MTLDLPYQTGLTLITGLVIVSVVYLITKAIIRIQEIRKK